ncbi:MAG: GAF domain-containing protein [Pseudonocardiaceae bacterium]
MCAGAAFVAQVTPEANLPPWASWTITLGGTAATMLAVLLVARQTWAEIRAREDAEQLAKAAVANYRLALESILLPLTDIFDRIVTAPDEAGRREAKGAIKQAVVNSAVQFADVPRARSCYFDYEYNNRLVCRIYAGRGSRPRTEFSSANRNHAEIFQLLESRRSTLIENVNTENPPSFPFDGDHETYISVPVATSAEIFGLLTLDTLHAGELSPQDEKEMLLLAQLLGIALASDGGSRGGANTIIAARGQRFARLVYSVRKRGNNTA